MRTEPRTDSTIDAHVWAVLAVAVTTQTAGSFASQGMYVLVPFWREVYGVSLATASLAVTAMNGAQIATMFALGRAIDRYGERIVVALAMSGMALSLAAAAAFADTFAALLACMIGLGAVYAAVQPGGTRAIMRWFPAGRRGLATGFRQAAVPFGTMMASAALPVLAVQYGPRFALWAAAAASFFGAAAFWLFYRDGGASKSTEAAPMAIGELLPTLGQVPGFWGVACLGVAMSAFQFTLTAHAIGFLAGSLGLSVVLAASLFAGAQLAGIPGRILLPWMSDRWRPGRRKQSLAAICVVGAIAALALMLVPADTPMPAVAFLLAILGLFGIGWFPLYVLEIAESAPKGSIAATVAFTTTLCMIAMALGPFLFGAAVDHFGYRIAWMCLSLPVIATAIPLLRNHAKEGRKG